MTRYIGEYKKVDEQEKPVSQLRVWIEVIDSYSEKAIDASIDHIGCTLAALIVPVILLIVLALGWAAYDTYAHRNQHCIHATREYVMIGKVLTPVDNCDTWQNN